jgi:hypothetical protein
MVEDPFVGKNVGSDPVSMRSVVAEFVDLGRRLDGDEIVWVDWRCCADDGFQF